MNKNKKKPDEKMLDDKLREQIDKADAFHSILLRIKESEDADTWTKICYGMYVGLRYNQNMLCRMAMLEHLKVEGANIEQFIQSHIDEVGDELKQQNKETGDE